MIKRVERLGMVY